MKAIPLSTILKIDILPATDTLGTRLKASGNGKQVTVPYPDHVSGNEIWDVPARAWVKKHGGKLIHKYHSQNAWRFLVR